MLPNMEHYFEDSISIDLSVRPPLYRTSFILKQEGLQSIVETFQEGM